MHSRYYYNNNASFPSILLVHYTSEFFQIAIILKKNRFNSIRSMYNHWFQNGTYTWNVERTSEKEREYLAKRANAVAVDSLEMYAGKSTFPWNVYARRYRNVEREVRRKESVKTYRRRSPGTTGVARRRWNRVALPVRNFPCPLRGRTGALDHDELCRSRGSSATPPGSVACNGWKNESSCYIGILREMRQKIYVYGHALSIQNRWMKIFCPIATWHDTEAICRLRLITGLYRGGRLI